MAQADSPGVRVGHRLRALREERLFSQRELAQAAGVSQYSVEKMERGQIPHPRRSTLAKLATALGVGLEDLIGPPRPLTPALNLPAMFRETDAVLRRRALEAASPEELARYVGDVDRALTATGRHMNDPELQGSGYEEGAAQYMQALLDLRAEAEPYAAPAAEDRPHASVGAPG